MYRRPGFNCVVCELRFFSEVAIIRTQCIDYAGVANTQHAQIAIFKFAIYLKKPEMQLFYYAIKTRPTVLHKYFANKFFTDWENRLTRVQCEVKFYFHR